MSHHALLLVFSLFFLNSFFSATSSLVENCLPTRCGSVNISYPFWLKSQTTPTATSNEYCGYQGLGLDCNNSSNELILTLPSDTYYVRNISYDPKTIHLVDMGVTTAGPCPIAQHNLTLDTVPFNFSTELDINLTFYFNCSYNHPFSAVVPVGCLQFGGNESYVFLEGTEPDGGETWYEYCKEKVVTPVMRREIDESNLTNVFGEAMNKGFVLNWGQLPLCGACEASHGRCGYSGTKFLCFCPDESIQGEQCYNTGHAENLKLKLGIGFAVGGITIVLFICIMICYTRLKTTSHRSIIFWQKKNDNQKLEDFIRNYGSLSPKRYSYSDVKKITNSFRDELGQGGYGCVYRGKLNNNRRLVAVKLLDASKGNGEDFINEVASISRTSHVNIVSLLGFCVEGRKKALIYEFMPNGSLEKFIYGEGLSKTNGHLGWEKLYRISIGIARGLEYLHRGCSQRILHFDIKPHNILLDEDFCPKISDFGLAKLFTKKESIISMMEARGTIGYIAPEVVSRNFGEVTHKSDVYSYGMMVLEIAGGRKNADNGASNTSKIYFPHWVYKRLELNEEIGFCGDMTEEENEMARRMILVGLWCIQTYPSQRPSMSKVVEMLEGSIEALQIPPRPYLYSPSTSSLGSSTT